MVDRDAVLDRIDDVTEWIEDFVLGFHDLIKTVFNRAANALRRFTKKTNMVLGDLKPGRENKMTLTVAELDALRPDEAIRLVGTDDASVWQRRADGFYVQQDGTGVLPGAAFIGYATAERVVRYDPNDVTVGQLRIQNGTNPNEGYCYLVLHEQAAEGYVYAARFNNGAFSDIASLGKRDLAGYPVASADNRPEWMIKSYGMLRALLRSGDYDLKEEAERGFGPMVMQQLHNVADEIDNEVLDDFLGVIGMPRPGLLAQVTVNIGGHMNWTPTNLPGGVQGVAMQVPWVKSFTYSSVGKGCRCEQPDMAGIPYADLVAAQTPEEAVGEVTIEVSCTHDEQTEAPPAAKKVAARKADKPKP